MAPRKNTDPKPAKPATATIGVTQAAALLNRSVPWVHLRVKDGYIAKEAHGKYTVTAVVHGAMAYYEDQLQKTTKTASTSNAQDARAEETRLRIDERKRLLIPREDAIMAMDILVGQVNRELSSLPARITRDVPRRREIEAKVYDAQSRIAAATTRGKSLAATGREAVDPDAEDAS